jgi:hypothetical protein
LRHRDTVVGMMTILSALVSILGFRIRNRASLELELISLRHQVSVLRRQHSRRLRLFSTDRLLWVWLHRVWPQTLNAMVRNPVQRGHRFQRKADSIPVIADSR